MKKRGMTRTMCLLLAGALVFTPFSANAKQLDAAGAEQNDTTETKHKITVKYYFESLEETDLEKDGVFFEELTDTYPMIETEVEDNSFYFPDIPNVNGYSLTGDEISFKRITEDTEFILYYTRNSYEFKVDIAKEDTGIKKVSYTVTTNNGSIVTEDIVKVKYGADITIKATMNTHHSFDKWVDEEGNVLGTAANYAITMPAKNLTATASSKLAEGYTYYTKSWYKEVPGKNIGITRYEEYKTETAIGKIGVETTIEADDTLSENEYTLNEKVAGTVKKATIEENGTVLQLFYDLKNYDLKYELDGATNSSANQKTFKPNIKQYVYPVTKEGYTFDGWYYDKEFKNKLSSSENKQYFETTSKSATTIYAKFNKNGNKSESKSALQEFAQGKEITAIGATYNKTGELVGNTLDTSLIELNVMFKDGTVGKTSYTSLCSEPLTQAIKEGSNTITFKIEDYEVKMEVTGYLGRDGIEIVTGSEVIIGTDIYKVTSMSKKEVSYKYNSKKNATVTIPEHLLVNNEKFKVTAINEKCFYKNKKVKKVTIPNSITRIGKNSFAGCTSLTTVTMGTGVKKIDAQAFNGCKKLKTINIKSKKLTTVGKNVFKGINKKAKFNLPKKKTIYNKYKKLLNKGQAKTCKYVKKYK